MSNYWFWHKVLFVMYNIIQSSIYNKIYIYTQLENLRRQEYFNTDILIEDIILGTRML